jgi:cytochrome c biogenesis protein CcdA
MKPLIKMRKQYLFLLLSIMLVLIPLSSASHAADPNTKYVCGVYFTGIGCPHCANIAPVVKDFLINNPNVALLRYEIYNKTDNVPIMDAYLSSYSVPPGIPLIMFSKDVYLRGDSPIIENLESTVASLGENPCPLMNGSTLRFNDLNCDSLPGRPEVLIENETIIGGGACVEPKQELTLAKILSLAAVDAVNPCEIAVLTMILIAILTADPKNKKKVLFAGLAFSFAIVLMYLVYGLVIIKFFQVVSLLKGVGSVIFKVLAVLAILLGIFNIRDFVRYRPGGFLTEMPIFLRPKVKKLIATVTSVKGAFVIGLLVTLFLIPCTMGPYFIAGGLLSGLELIKTLPWLLLYNLVFILPMIVITLIVYFGFTTVENVSGWKERNIRYLHLIAGIILVILGIAMLLGWV